MHLITVQQADGSRTSMITHGFRVDSEAELQAIEANLASSTRRVVHYLHKLWTSGAAELCLVLRINSRTFDSPSKSVSIQVRSRYHYYLTLWEIFTTASLRRFSLGSKWQQVSTAFLSIRADSNNAVVWMLSFPSLWESFQVHQLRLESLALSCFTTCNLTLCLVFWLRFGNPFVYQNYYHVYSFESFSHQR